ncbi:MAG: GNAT family N-acetyltransferase [Haloplanus sp.]
MEFVLLGWPPDGPTLRLDYRRFAYAGKFVVGSTGKAVVRDPEGDSDSEYDDAVRAAASFSPDRTDADRLCIRYVTVRDDHRGAGLGSRLLAFVADRAEARGYERVRIAVNNPVAYGAAYRAGFGFTGEETGLAELVCERPGPRDAETYRAGLDQYRERDLDDDTMARLDEKRDGDPPAVVDPPSGTGDDAEPGC